MNIAEVEAKLVAACEKAIADGWMIKPGRMFGYGCMAKTCCALGAMVTTCNRTDVYTSFNKVMLILGLSSGNTTAIARGFDALEGEEYDPAFVAIGARLRARYVKP